MIASLDFHLAAVRLHGEILTETIPAARPFVTALRFALDAIAESVAVLPEADRPPLTRKEAAGYLAISTTTFDVLRRKGEIVACGENGFPSGVGFRRQLRFAKSELDRILGAK